MAVSQAKENILKKIRQALSNPVPLPFPHSEGAQSVYTPAGDDHAIVFAEEFTKLQGKFAFCANGQELKKQLLQLAHDKGWAKIYCSEPSVMQLLDNSFTAYPALSSCDVSITSCEC